MAKYAYLDGKKVVPCSFEEYLDTKEEECGRRVRFTKVVSKDKEGITISTVFLAIDHGFGGAPQWFETMIFGGEYDQICERASTYEEAEKNHEKAVSLVTKIEKRKASWLYHWLFGEENG